MIHTPLNYSSAEQWAGFPHTPGGKGEKRREREVLGRGGEGSRRVWRARMRMRMKESLKSFTKMFLHFETHWEGVSCSKRLNLNSDLWFYECRDSRDKKTHPWTHRLCPSNAFYLCRGTTGSAWSVFQAFETPNTHVCKHRHTHPFFILSFSQVRANPWLSTVYAFNKPCRVNAISHAYKCTLEMYGRTSRIILIMPWDRHAPLCWEMKRLHEQGTFS